MKKISELTNSEIGSAHWFNIITSFIFHTGEQMSSDRDISVEATKAQGIIIRAYIRELQEWFNQLKEEYEEN